MAQRYEVIKSVKDGYWSGAYPLLLAAHALVRDNADDRINAQCKFSNLSGRNVAAAYIAVDCKGVDGGAVEGIDEYVYLDLDSAPGAVFGDDKLIALPNKTTRSYTVTLKKVVFADGAVWQAPGGGAFSPLANTPKPLSVLGELEAQYRRSAAQSANIPEEFDDYWYCGCGQLNLNEQENCVHCKISLQAQLAALDTDTLKRDLENYGAEQLRIAEVRLEMERKENEKRLETERRRQEQEQIAAGERARIAKRKKKTALIVTPIAVVVVAFVIVFLTVIQPSMKYARAVTLRNSGDYEGASALFSSLGNYKNSPEQAKNATKLENQRQAEERVREAEKLYKQGDELFENGDYLGAQKIFQEIGDYKDSTKKALDERIRWAGVWYYTRDKGTFIEIDYSLRKMRDQYSKGEWTIDCVFFGNEVTTIASGSVKSISYTLNQDGTSLKDNEGKEYTHDK
ncbi:MAG: hypothetical protein LBM98_11895 [Oscillospiraceae bacterium]|jgi:TolA-binding protein|nr:hypothetical protein [Oscillospiraceae bacterium]